MSVTTDQLIPALAVLRKAPKLIITDSQVFGYVYENKPAESMLTSFSVLFAAYKGDLPYYVEGAGAYRRAERPFQGTDRGVLYPCTAEGGRRKRKDSADV